MTAVKFKHLALGPDAWVRAGFDTQQHFWNDRWAYGGGIKASTPWLKAVSSLKVGYECVVQYHGTIPGMGRSACGIAGQVDFWTGIRSMLGGK
jgi:hypothetical protein